MTSEDKMFSMHHLLVTLTRLKVTKFAGSQHINQDGTHYWDFTFDYKYMPYYRVYVGGLDGHWDEDE